MYNFKHKFKFGINGVASNYRLNLVILRGDTWEQIHLWELCTVILVQHTFRSQFSFRDPNKSNYNIAILMYSYVVMAVEWNQAVSYNKTQSGNSDKQLHPKVKVNRFLLRRITLSKKDVFSISYLKNCTHNIPVQPCYFKEKT